MSRDLPVRYLVHKPHAGPALCREVRIKLPNVHASADRLCRIRLGLRAELGAFYPLLVLRYLEQQQAYLASAAAAAQQQQQQQVQPPDPGNVSAALSALHGLLADPQLLVDLYVNFDCDLQAANLFERTVQVGCHLLLHLLADSNALWQTCLHDMRQSVRGSVVQGFVCGCAEATVGMLCVAVGHQRVVVCGVPVFVILLCCSGLERAGCHE